MWLRTGEQHAQLSFSNFKLKHETPASECVLFVPGGGSDSYRMFATAETPSRCPVQLFRTYLKKWYVPRVLFITISGGQEGRRYELDRPIDTTLLHLITSPLECLKD